jgi:hypothetical protein
MIDMLIKKNNPLSLMRLQDPGTFQELYILPECDCKYLI